MSSPASSADRLVVLTGMSGAGKSTALRTFEDLGYFCIDNLPPTLIETFLQLHRQTESAERGRGVAIVCDIRSGALFGSLRDAIALLRQHGYEPEVLFFDCADDVLVQRYSASRRPGPLGPEVRPVEAIKLERAALDPLKDLATHTIDTTELRGGQLRERLLSLYGRETSGGGGVAVTIVTFGFKHGIPPDADFLFDTRWLPNPFYVEGLRELTGRDEPVRDYILAHPEAADFVRRAAHALAPALAHYGDVGKPYAVVAIGCTGGRHRSVCLAGELCAALSAAGVQCTVQHRDLGRA